MKVCIIEVWGSVDDDGPQTFISGEDVPRDKSEHLSMVVYPSGDSLNPLGHILHRHKNTLPHLKVGKVP